MSGLTMLNPQFYDSRLLSMFNDQGVLIMPIEGLGESNLQLAFMRGAVRDWYRLIDVAYSPVVDAGGNVVPGQLLLTKIFRLTDEGRALRTRLQILYPPT